MRRIKKFLSLTWREQRLLIEAGFVLAAAAVVVNVTSLAWLKRWTRYEPASTRARGFSYQQICWSVKSACRVIPFTTCLARALATQLLMKHSGYGSVMRIGVCKRGSGEFSAHAWIEHEGQV